LEIHVPGGTQHDALQAALERLKPTLGVDITLRPIESVQL